MNATSYETDVGPNAILSHAATALRVVKASLARAWGYLVLSPAYMDAQAPERVAEKALGSGGAARHRLHQRDVEDCIDGLRQRGASHVRRLAQQRRARLECEIVHSAVHSYADDAAQ
jgi:hypothetical protein